MHKTNFEIRSEQTNDIETYVGPNWREVLSVQLGQMSRFAFSSVASVRTKDDAIESAFAILDHVKTEERETIEQHITNMSRNGENVVIRANFNSPEGHAFYHLVGAYMQNVGSEYLFAFPLQKLLKIRALELNDTNILKTDIEKTQTKTSEQIDTIIPPPLND